MYIVYNQLLALYRYRQSTMTKYLLTCKPAMPRGLSHGFTFMCGQEKDLEMLQMAGISCAVGNALPAVKYVAQYSDFPSNDDSGVATIIEKFIFGEEARKCRLGKSAGGFVDA